MKPRNYQCRKCGKINQITTLWGMLLTPHFGWHKWLKCECGAKRHFQRRIFEPELKIKDRLQGAHQTIDFQTAEILRLEADLDRAQRECDEADGYYCSLIDNLRDDIRELKNEKAELVRKLERLVYDTHLKDVFEEIDDAMMNNHTLDADSDHPMPHYYEELKEDIDAIKKKYGVEG